MTKKENGQIKPNGACFSRHLSTTNMPSVVSRFNSLLGGKRKSLISSSAQEQPQIAQVFLVLISTYHAAPALKMILFFGIKFKD
jgi:hypothetical protein